MANVQIHGASVSDDALDRLSDAIDRLAGAMIGNETDKSFTIVILGDAAKITYGEEADAQTA